MAYIDPLSDEAMEMRDKQMYEDYYGREAYCKDCEHYIQQTRQCERKNEDGNDYIYAYRDPYSRPCKDFEHEQYDPFELDREEDY